MSPSEQGATSADALLQSGEACWRTTQAPRCALLPDNRNYFAAARWATQQARRSIWVIGWEFNPRRRLTPDRGEAGEDQIGPLLLALSGARPDLDICLLVWDAALLISLNQGFMPRRAKKWFRNSRVRFRLDATVPNGTAHHQKLVVVDDALAFCATDDFTTNRWDRPETAMTTLSSGRWQGRLIRRATRPH